MKQNITLSLEKALLMKVKVLAAQREMSVTKLLSTELQRILEDEESYAAAMKRAFEEMDETTIVIGGTITWSRDELHER